MLMLSLYMYLDRIMLFLSPTYNNSRCVYIYIFVCLYVHIFHVPRIVDAALNI